MGKLIVKTEFLEKTMPVVLVQVGGYIDQSNADKLQKIFDDLYSSEHFFLIFDMASMIYMSSAGWGIFVGEVKRYRENGGDIKLANMNSEIYELFQMLEFYHILEDYYSIEEALESFGVKVEKHHEEEEMPMSGEEDIPGDAESALMNSGHEPYDGRDGPAGETPEGYYPESSPVEFKVSKDQEMYQGKMGTEMEMDISILPTQEKIRKIISKFPLISLTQMKRMLRHEEFGKERINIFKLYFMLKSMNLETKAKRYRYYRSC